METVTQPQSAVALECLCFTVIWVLCVYVDSSSPSSPAAVNLHNDLCSSVQRDVEDAVVSPHTLLQQMPDSVWEHVLLHVDWVCVGRSTLLRAVSLFREYFRRVQGTLRSSASSPSSATHNLLQVLPSKVSKL
uniref:Protein moxR n=1 Tax=Lygus hesperus TaxID=30085 RepID=A0A0A9YV77_LYGHE